MAKAKRNDPCPCGSGKKFKKCCMGSEAAGAPVAEQQEAPKGPPQGDRPSGAVEAFSPIASPRMNEVPPVPDPEEREEPEATEEPEEDDPLGDLWKEFKAAAYEHKIELFHQALEQLEGEDDDCVSDYAFEFLTKLHSLSVKRGERGRFAGCVEALRVRQPRA